jgi:disulfide oxidoreductase YuzD
VRDELARRFGGSARIDYVSLADDASARENAPLVSRIEETGLLFPVTVIDGEPVYDGAVSYPAILREVEARLGGTE